MNDSCFMYDDAGDLWEVPEEDCELDGDEGFWYLAAEGEDFEDFYAFDPEDTDDPPEAA